MAYRPPAPFAPPITGSVEQRLRLIADAISKKADQTLLPVYNAVVLVSPGGVAWQLSVDDSGALQVSVMQR